METGHARLETNVGLMIVLVIILMSIGGIATVVPLFFQNNLSTPVAGLEPYSALQLEGRDIYIREGCNTCHSQMIRPFRAETERYGHYSVAGEFVYDRPFLWGSKRTGPDLHRVGGRYSDAWHRVHLINPRDVVPESIMPGYPWLQDATLDAQGVRTKMRVLRTLGHPYTDAQIEQAPAALEGRTEMDALIAYLQALGIHVKTREIGMFAQIHSWWSVLLLVVFIAIVIWAYSSRRSKDFDEAARLALDDDDVNRGPRNGGRDG